AERPQQPQETARAALEHADALSLRHSVGQQGTGLLGAEMVERVEHRPEAGQIVGNFRGVHRLGAVGNRPLGETAGPLEGLEIGMAVTQTNVDVDTQLAQPWLEAEPRPGGPGTQVENLARTGRL